MMERKAELMHLLRGDGIYAADWLPRWGADGSQLPPAHVYGPEALADRQAEQLACQIVGMLAPGGVDLDYPLPVDQVRYWVRRLAAETTRHPLVLHARVVALCCLPMGAPDCDADALVQDWVPVS